MKNIILIGFMGTGKTSTGKILANRIGYAFADMDQRIERKYGMSIKEMFEKKNKIKLILLFFFSYLIKD